MGGRMGTGCGLLIFLVLTAGSVEAQEEPESLRLFFDCQASGCFDPDYFRREIGFVEWVRDREASDLHVLITSQETGSGGRQYTVAFIPRESLEGERTELGLATRGDATADEQRSALSERVKLGLIHYLGLDASPVLDDLRVVLSPETAVTGGRRGRPGCGLRRRSLGLLGLPHQRQRLPERASDVERHEPVRVRVGEPNHRGAQAPGGGGLQPEHPEVRVPGR
jgi:hypothetical protein